MGLDYSYLLYFDRKVQWEALQAVVDISEPHQPPTRILFPDHELLIPMESWSSNNGVLKYNDPELQIHTSIYFEEDDAILDYLQDRNGDKNFRSPPEGNQNPKVSIGYIYLTIYNESSQRYSGIGASNYVAFDFGTTGTSMSMLFYYSHSIRGTFVKLLERVPGICGVFNQEDGGGEIFWYRGHHLSKDIADPFMPLTEIESLFDFEN
jgi:hypothetical protein